MGNPIIQIVPALPPPATGVGDYALCLAAELRAACGIDTAFVSARDAPARHSGFTVAPLRHHSAGELVRALEEQDRAAVLLQLSPYGYEKHGCPLWLAHGLRDWTSRGRGRILVTVFHELDASGPPWTRTFWVSWLQRRVIRDIQGSSHAAITSTAAFVRKLCALAPTRAAPVALAIPSNVGEPESVPSIAERPRRLAVFGIRPGAGFSRRVVGELERILRLLSIEEVALIGDQPAGGVLSALPCAVRAYQGLTAIEISRLLSASILGLSSYPPRYLAKSGVYAAYCAHGVPALVFADPSGEPAADDGLEHGRHYVAASKLFDGRTLQDMSGAMRAWYGQHGVRQHAGAVAALTRGMR